MMDINILIAFGSKIITEVLLFVKQRIFLFVSLQKKRVYSAYAEKKNGVICSYDANETRKGRQKNQVEFFKDQ